MNLPYNIKNKSIAKILRKTMTKEERHLWYDFLSIYPLKFYRQRKIENYIVDFYCSSAKLVIEIDGSQHYDETNIMADKKRELVLKKHKLHVMRFSNLEINKYFKEVCTAIDTYINFPSKKS